MSPQITGINPSLLLYEKTFQALNSKRHISWKLTKGVSCCKMGMEILKKTLKIIFYCPNFQSTPKGGSLNGTSAKGKKAVQLRLWHLEQPLPLSAKVSVLLICDLCSCWWMIKWSLRVSMTTWRPYFIYCQRWRRPCAPDIRWMEAKLAFYYGNLDAWLTVLSKWMDTVAQWNKTAWLLTHCVTLREVP